MKGFETKSQFQVFAELAKNVAKASKADSTIYGSVVKRGDTLLVSNGEEWLRASYQGEEPDGTYNFFYSAAYGALRNRKEFDDDLAEPKIEFDSPLVDVTAQRASAMLTAYTSVAESIARSSMMGIHFDAGHVVSTDGCRLFCAPGFDDFPAVTVPKKRIITAMLTKATDIKCAASSNNAYTVFAFTYNSMSFRYCVRNIENQFPHWQRAIPKDQKYSMGVPDIASWKAIYKLWKRLKNDSVEIYLKANADKQSVGITDSNGNSVGEIQWPGFYTDEFAGKPLGIACDYLNDALTLDGLIQINYTDFARAMTFCYSDGSLFVVMPMKVEH